MDGTQEEAERSPIFGARRGWTLRQRLRGKESYGVLLGMIILSLMAAAAAESVWGGPQLAIAMQGGVLLFALWTSRSGRWALRLALILVPIIVVAAISVSGSETDAARGGVSATSALLSFAAIAAIARRLAAHPRVDAATILGALSVYLLIGITFSAVFKTVGIFSGEPFFASQPVGQIAYLYFSFVTLTTTGYGDLVAATDVGRMLAVTEALLGQLYLVSVVAFVIGNVGRGRGAPPPA